MFFVIQRTIGEYIRLNAFEDSEWRQLFIQLVDFLVLLYDLIFFQSSCIESIF